MKNLTLSAEDHLIEAARLRAQSERTTLNALFREWLAAYVSREGARGEYEELMDRLSHVKAPGRFTRDELNER